MMKQLKVDKKYSTHNAIIPYNQDSWILRTRLLKTCIHADVYNVYKPNKIFHTENGFNWIDPTTPAKAILFSFALNLRKVCNFSNVNCVYGTCKILTNEKKKSWGKRKENTFLRYFILITFYCMWLHIGRNYLAMIWFIFQFFSRQNTNVFLAFKAFQPAVCKCFSIQSKAALFYYCTSSSLRIKAVTYTKNNQATINISDIFSGEIRKFIR